MKLLNMIKAIVLGSLFLVVSHDDAMAASMKRKQLGVLVTHPFAGADKAEQKRIYDALTALDALIADQDAVIAAVTAAVNNADVFARLEVTSKIDSVATISFNKHVIAVQEAMGEDFANAAEVEIQRAGEAFNAWIGVFSTDGGETVKNGCEVFAKHLVELYDCVQGLIDAHASHVRATAIVLVKQRVDELTREVEAKRVEHEARSARLALLPGQLEAEKVALESRVLALQTITNGRQAVRTVGEAVRDVAADYVTVDDL